MPDPIIIAVMLAIAAIPGALVARRALTRGHQHWKAALACAGATLYCLPVTLPLSVLILAFLGYDLFD